MKWYQWPCVAMAILLFPWQPLHKTSVECWAVGAYGIRFQTFSTHWMLCGNSFMSCKDIRSYIHYLSVTLSWCIYRNSNLGAWLRLSSLRILDLFMSGRYIWAVVLFEARVFPPPASWYLAYFCTLMEMLSKWLYSYGEHPVSLTTLDNCCFQWKPSSVYPYPTLARALPAEGLSAAINPLFSAAFDVAFDKLWLIRAILISKMRKFYKTNKLCPYSHIS